MNYELRYSSLDRYPLFYKDIFIIYRDLIRQRIQQEELPSDIVQIANNELINVNRAPLIVIKRVSSAQPPNVNNVNERVERVGNTMVARGASVQTINMAMFSYGNSYLEAEKLGSLIQEAIIITSINKIRELSNGAIIGHEYLGWSGTDYLNRDSKLMMNRIDIRITITLQYSVSLNAV